MLSNITLKLWLLRSKFLATVISLMRFPTMLRSYAQSLTASVIFHKLLCLHRFPLSLTANLLSLHVLLISLPLFPLTFTDYPSREGAFFVCLKACGESAWPSAISRKLSPLRQFLLSHGVKQFSLRRFFLTLSQSTLTLSEYLISLLTYPTRLGSLCLIP